MKSAAADHAAVMTALFLKILKQRQISRFFWKFMSVNLNYVGTYSKSHNHSHIIISMTVPLHGECEFFPPQDPRASHYKFKFRTLKLRRSVTCDGFKKRLWPDDSGYFIKNRSIRCRRIPQKIKFALGAVRYEGWWRVERLHCFMYKSWTRSNRFSAILFTLLFANGIRKK